MKKLLTLACLTIGLINSSFGQKTDFTSKLIASKEFAFVVNKIERKPGSNALLSSRYNFNTSTTNPSTADMHMSMYITTYRPIESFDLRNYYDLAAQDGSYFKAFQINQNVARPNKETGGTSIFLIQHSDRILIKGSDSPTSMLDVYTEALNIVKTQNFKLSQKRKKDRSWHLTYEVQENKNKRVFYLDVAENGMAILKDQPTEDYTMVMYGYLISTLPTQNL